MWCVDCISIFRNGSAYYSWKPTSCYFPRIESIFTSCILPGRFGNTFYFIRPMPKRSTGMLRRKNYNPVETPSNLDPLLPELRRIVLPPPTSLQELGISFICSDPTPTSPSGFDTFIVEYFPMWSASLLIIHILRMQRKRRVFTLCVSPHLRILLGAKYKANSRVPPLDAL